MDFERASIKALFYDYPVEAVVKAIVNSRKSKDGYLDILPQLVRWREIDFTTTEARLMEDLSHDIWMKLDNANLPFVYRPLLLIKYLAQRMLTQDPITNRPRVIFEELLRWKETVLHVGEDLFTTAYLADKETKCPHTKVFDWEDKIWHNQYELNAKLDKGLTDIHSHYNASADIFNINWISYANGVTDMTKMEKRVHEYQDINLSIVGTEVLYPMKRICIAASYLRLQFYKALFVQNQNAWNNVQHAIRILQDEIYAERISYQIQSEISVFRSKAFKDIEDRAIDYAIENTHEVVQNCENAYLIFHGERRIMYEYFSRFFQCDRQAVISAPYFYLYIVLKTRIRKEFVQVNQLKGFENFETYQERKGIFLSDEVPLGGVMFNKIAFQTTVRSKKCDYLEGRISPNDIKKYTEYFINANYYNKGIFSHINVYPEANKHLAFVVHFIKANYSKSLQQVDFTLNQRPHFARYANYRKNLREDMNFVVNLYNRQRNYSPWDPRQDEIKIIGIDAASTEMFCRPEVFGHAFRYAKRCGLYNRTYHVGEDFFDIIDGLRAIDEALLFLDLDAHSRIGHGLAAGIDAKNYYDARRYRIIGPKQYILDNCVWLCKTAAYNKQPISNALETELKDKAYRYYEQIGYPMPFDIDTYWNSMLLRGDEPYEFDDKDSRVVGFSAWDMTSDTHVADELVEARLQAARSDKRARMLYKAYHYSQKIKVNGDMRDQDKYLNRRDIVHVVRQLQAVMRKKIAERQIAIETNPTSNLKIGFINEYKEHPLLTVFDPIEKQNDIYYPLQRASVNTDDRGVFDTTVYTELSLLAIALRKQYKIDGSQVYGTRQIIDYIDHLREANEKQRFTI